MPRYIDADALSNFANNQVGGITANHIMRFPTADVEPVRHGRWINVIGDDYECSICKAAIWARKANPISEYKYCWSCGAKMYGGENK